MSSLQTLRAMCCYNKQFDDSSERVHKHRYVLIKAAQLQ